MKHINGDSKSSITNVQDGDIQPNATDLRVLRVFKINPSNFLIDEEQKKHRGSMEVVTEKDGYWHLDIGQSEVVMDNNIIVAEGEAGFVITRSTLNRNGVFLTSGLYDSGYDGCMAACMHVGSGIMKVKPGTRIGQYLNFDAETLYKYDGDYGNNKLHDKKYSE